ncbi:unnamed protein product [Brachionus calyciflorus]|uniref:Uncharacterized protein n=1 Tax=Brachionus calyciflorus TaxID=104777 RepID=A0A813ZKH8_9BILA|nr:unnamed protein product [Brachionus calyciflorus]
MELDSTSSTNHFILDENDSLWSRFQNRLTCSKVSVVNSTNTQFKKNKSEKIDKIFEYVSKKLNSSNKAEDDIREIEKLIKKGWDVHFKTNEKDNALHLIAEVKPKEKSVILYKYLVDKGLKPEENYYGINVLHSAVLSDNELLIKYLFESSGKENEFLNSKTYGGFQTPLHLAAKVGANNAILCLIEKGADKEAEDYLGRTPLYLAAEYRQPETVRLLMEKGCNINVVNKNGQKALYWIIAKCRNLAPEVLDKYRKLDKYNYKDTYYLKNVELEPISLDKNSLKDKNTHQVPYVKSILEFIVEQHDLELITHPVIRKLIAYKWKNYYWFWPVIKFIIDLLFCVVWNLWGVLIPYPDRYMYKLPQEIWRIILFILGFIGVVIIIISEIREALKQRSHNIKIKNVRLNEILDEGAKVHPRDKTQNSYLFNEEILCKKNQGFKRLYLSDGWNQLDLITIILLIASLATHLADILNHNETIAKNHIRVTSITVIVLSLRLLKTARTLWMPFGMLVMTLYYIARDIIVWILAFIIIWIPFTTCFYMLFGNGLTVNCDSDTQTCSAENKTLQYNELDDKISNFIVGLYIGATTLILVNIFIALLSSTFERVHSFSKGVFLIERAKEIIQLERSLSENTRIKRLQNIPYEYITKFKPENSKDDVGLEQVLEPVKESLRDMNNKYESLRINLINVENKYGDLNLNQSLDIEKIERKLDDIKLCVDKLIEFQEIMRNKAVSESRVDVLYLNDIGRVVDD